MVRYAFLLASLALVACKGDDKGGETGTADGGDGGDGGEDGGDGCNVEITPSYPQDGADDAYYRAAIEFTLTEEASDASITLTQGGTAVEGSSSVTTTGSGVVVLSFTPSSPLAPSTEYTAEASACGGDASGSVTFTTSALGTPTTCDPTDKTFTVNLASGRIIEPTEALAALLGELDQEILLGVSSVSDTSIQITGAIGEGGEQDYCTPTIDFPEADYTNPYFEIGPEDISFAVSDFEVKISNLRVSGDIAPDCNGFGGGVLAGDLDARDLDDALAEAGLITEANPDEVCSTVAAFGVVCEPCADGEPYCVGVLVDQLVGDAGAATVVCVDEEMCHPQCDESTCGDPTAGECE